MKWSQPNLFSEEQLDAMVTSRSGKPMIKYIDHNGNIFYQPDNRKTLADFVEQARKIWGDQYDYSGSVYIDKHSPITIYCPKHDIHFTVDMAQNHVIKPSSKGKATGCPVCQYERQYGKQYGPEWRETLRLSPKQNRVGLIRQKHSRTVKTREQIAAEKAEREAKAEARRREEQAYIDKWKAKDIYEARFKERVFQMYGDQYDMALVDYQGNDKEVTLLCPKHGFFEIRPRVLLVGTSHSNSKKTAPHGCWKCCGLQDPADRFVLTAKDFNQRVQKLYHPKVLTFPLKRKIKPTDKITAVCSKHGEITHDAMWWYHGKGCEYCHGKWYAPHWKDYARRVHGDKYEYVGDAPVKHTDYIHYICPKHGLQEQKYSIHVGLGCGCPKCANYPNKKSPLERCQEWIAKCIEKYGEGRYDYSHAHEDYVNNDSLVWIRCCLHDHWFKTTPDNNLRTANGSCPVCSAEFTETQGEAEVRRWLLKHDIINFKQDEVTLPNENPRCRRQYLRPDFWLPDYNLFIEYNGEQHYEDVDYFFNDDFTFEDQQIRDQTLRDYCQRHGHRLLEIPYWDFQRIGEILTDELLNN